MKEIHQKNFYVKISLRMVVYGQFGIAFSI